MRLPRTGALLGLMLGLAIMFVAACGSDDNKDKAGSTAAPAGATTAAQTGGRPNDAAGDDQQILRASYVEPQYLDPHRSSFASDIGVERMLFRGLFQLDKDAKPVPAMAVELPTQQNGGISADGKKITVKMKPGLKWSDGSALTSKDFQYSITRVLDPTLATDYGYLMEAIAGGSKLYSSKATGAELEQLKASLGIKTPDDNTIEFTLDEPDPLFVLKLSLWAAFPVKKDIVEKEGEKAFTEAGKLVGNGPYMLKEYKLKESITLAPNPNWALTPKPVLKEIRLRIIDDTERAFDAYRNNELEMLYDVPATKLQQITSDSQLKAQYIQQKSVETRGLHMNEAVKPLDNVKVRQALAKALDREAIVKTVFSGKYIPTTQWIPAGVPGIQQLDVAEQKFDAAAAKQLLTDAGFPNGQGFPKLKLLLRDNKEARDLGEFLKTDLKKNLNIDIDLEVVDGQTRSSRFNKSDFELFYGGWIQDFPDPENWIDGLWNTKGGNNHVSFSNPELDTLLKNNKFNLNNEQRLAAYRQMHDVVNKTVAIANIYHGAYNYLIKPKVGGANVALNDAMLPGDWNAESWYIKK
jgi:oligopeptide transport system substrate-binding protein